MNIVFDLGGVVVTWEPEVVIAKVFTDPVVQAKVRTQIIGHADWLALDRGTLSQQDAITRAAKRSGLSEADVTEFLRQVPSSLIAIPGTIDLLYRLKAKDHSLFCLSNMHVASIDHLEKSYTFWEVFAGAVISCRLQLCKPEPAIFTYLLEKYGLDGADTVFIDDGSESVSGRTVWHTHNQVRESSAMREPVTGTGLYLTRRAGNGFQRLFRSRDPQLPASFQEPLSADQPNFRSRFSRIHDSI